MKPLFSNKSKTANTITLHKSNRIIRDDKKILHTLKKYFTNLTKTLKLKKTSSALKKKYRKHLLGHIKNHSIKKSKNILMIKKYLLLVNLHKLKS